MKEILLNYLCCPHDKQDFVLAVTNKVGDEIISGSLSCTHCNKKYPVKNGIPIILDDSTLQEKKIADGFGYEWRQWKDLANYNQTENQFLDWVSPLEKDFFGGRVILDAGCGMGRWDIVMSRFGAKLIIGFDLGCAVNSAYENCRKYPNIQIVRASIFNMPFKPKFDLAFSLGVIHHTPDPGLAFYNLSQMTNKSLYCWVYGYENNEWIVRYINPIRERITHRLPFGILKTVSFFITVILHPSAKILSRINFRYKSYLKWLASFNFRHTFHVVFDHLVTPIAFYLKRSQILEWNKKTNFAVYNVLPRNDNSWKIYCEKK